MGKCGDLLDEDFIIYKTLVEENGINFFENNLPVKACVYQVRKCTDSLEKDK